MTAGMPPADDLLLEVSDLRELEAALEVAMEEDEDLLPAPYSAEEWLINLQNHILWGTIKKAGDEAMRLVAGLALCRAATRLGVSPYRLPGRCGEIAAWILPEPGGGDGDE